MPQVKTKYGTVEGAVDKRRGTVMYAGIPFAAPPTGELRWKEPVAPAGWEGVMDCTRFRAAPLQNIMPIPNASFPCYGQEYFITKEDPKDEDCLYLNVWTPEGIRENAGLPVIMIICGGGYAYGTGAIPVISGKNLAASGVVVVTINYRLGALGFMGHPELTAESPNGASGNYGILDQIAALKWIKENIACFGGDPDNVTIAGESAGAYSVSILCSSPLATGLFHKAVAQSGSMITTSDTMTVTLKEAEAFGLEVMKKMGASSIKELRGIPAERFVGIKGPLRHIRDGYLLPETPGIVNDVPILIGNNSDEGRTFFKADITLADFEKQLRERYGDHYETIRRVYLENYPDVSEAFYAEDRDSRHEFRMLSWATIHTESAHSPAYLYYFDRGVPRQDFGAFHSSNLQYFYRNLDCNPSVCWEDIDYRLSDAMSAYLVNFMRTGNPNGAGLPEWRPFGENREQVMELGEHIGMIDRPHKPAMDAMKMIYG